MRQTYQSAHRFAAIALAGSIFACATVNTSFAHEGPPFPILMDEPLASYKVSVWADPDIGEATFYIVVETPDGGIPLEEPDVALWVKPVSGRLDRVELPGKRQSLRNRMQFEVKPYFDQLDQWNVGIRIGADGLEANELVTQVESTPPGLGVWDFAIYLFPFVLFGGLWVVGLVRRRGQRPSQRQTEVPAERETADTLETNSSSSPQSASERRSETAEVRS